MLKSSSFWIVKLKYHIYQLKRRNAIIRLMQKQTNLFFECEEMMLHASRLSFSATSLTNIYKSFVSLRFSLWCIVFIFIFISLFTNKVKNGWSSIEMTILSNSRVCTTNSRLFLFLQIRVLVHVFYVSSDSKQSLISSSSLISVSSIKWSTSHPQREFWPRTEIWTWLFFLRFEKIAERS